MRVDYGDIGQRIREARRDRAFTQEQLAEMVGIGVTHVSHIETGNTIPSLKVFISILNALDVSADELLCDNLDNAMGAFSSELDATLSDCSEEEIRVITDVAKALKESMRKRLR